MLYRPFSASARHSSSENWSMLSIVLLLQITTRKCSRIKDIWTWDTPFKEIQPRPHVISSQPRQEMVSQRNFKTKREDGSCIAGSPTLKMVSQKRKSLLLTYMPNRRSCIRPLKFLKTNSSDATNHWIPGSCFWILCRVNTFLFNIGNLVANLS